MPLYTYRCQDCQAILELLIKNIEFEPKRCGHQCSLQRGEQDNIRGLGALHRSYRDIGGVAGNIQQQAASVGLSTYKKDGDGNFRRLGGGSGPEILPQPDKP